MGERDESYTALREVGSAIEEFEMVLGIRSAERWNDIPESLAGPKNSYQRENVHVGYAPRRIRWK